jgi:hypothetical protein
MSFSAEALAAEMHLLYRAGNAPVNLFPYPHVYVRDVFPPAFYRELVRHIPPSETLKPISDLRPVSAEYGKTRWILPLQADAVAALAQPYRDFWHELGGRLMNGNFGALLLSRFEPFVRQRFQDMTGVEFAAEAMLVQDYTDYALGPHTDRESKVLSVLFYLPADDSQAHLGTSIYLPKAPGFTCPGGPHHPFDRFDRVATMPYVPNSMFAFLKTPNAFHGVEPIREAGVKRSLLLYDIQYGRSA